MSNFHTISRGFFSRIGRFDIKDIVSQKNILIVSFVLVARLSVVSIAKFIYKIYRKITDKPGDTSKSQVINKPKECLSLKNASTQTDNNEEECQLEEINIQKFFALRNSDQTDIDFRLLHDILRFGLVSIEKISSEEEDTSQELAKDSGAITELIDHKVRTKYSLVKNNSLDLSQDAVEMCSRLCGDHSQLSIEEKLLYTGLGIIGAYSSTRETKQRLESMMDEDNVEVKDQSTKDLDIYENILARYLDLYIEVCKESDEDLNRLIVTLDEDTLLSHLDIDSESPWEGADSRIIDKTSLLLILNMSKTLKLRDESIKENIESITEMILDRRDFSSGLKSIGELKREVVNLKDKSCLLIYRS
ncbi:MAG: hypothetical protein KAH32_05835 [Chlamydiia bacterium]|nr:hypothetical protein [Chlamydiia bacterium]